VSTKKTHDEDLEVVSKAFGADGNMLDDPLMKDVHSEGSQIEAEESESFEALSGEILPPPYNPRTWAATMDISTRLSRCIWILVRNVVGLGGLALVVAGIWGLGGWEWGVIVAGLPVGGFYLVGELRAIATRREE